MLQNMDWVPALLKRAARMAACLALTFACAAHADDLDDFNRAVEAAMSHHRVASGYLRTGNIELATLELDGMREAWAKVSTLPRPTAFKDPDRYTGTMLQIAAGLVGTSLVLSMGNADIARELLDKVRKSLSELRRENNVTVLADCVLDANTAMNALFAHDREPDWESVTAGAEFMPARSSVATAWRRPVSATTWNSAA